MAIISANGNLSIVIKLIINGSNHQRSNGSNNLMKWLMKSENNESNNGDQ